MQGQGGGGQLPVPRLWALPRHLLLGGDPGQRAPQLGRPVSVLAVAVGAQQTAAQPQVLVTPLHGQQHKRSYRTLVKIQKGLTRD